MNKLSDYLAVSNAPTSSASWVDSNTLVLQSPKAFSISFAQFISVAGNPMEAVVFRKKLETVDIELSLKDVNLFLGSIKDDSEPNSNLKKAAIKFKAKL